MQARSPNTRQHTTNPKNKTKLHANQQQQQQFKGHTNVISTHHYKKYRLQEKSRKVMVESIIKNCTSYNCIF